MKKPEYMWALWSDPAGFRVIGRRRVDVKANIAEWFNGGGWEVARKSGWQMVRVKVQKVDRFPKRRI
jgi:hypothetical protein